MLCGLALTLRGNDFVGMVGMQELFISHINTRGIPSGKLGLAMGLIMMPLVHRLMEGILMKSPFSIE